MRFKLTSSLIPIFFLLLPRLDTQQNQFPVLKGPYLGQKPPGTQPEVFGPGVLSVDENFEHSAAVFSPRGDEVFWCTNVGMYTESGRQGMLRLYHMTVVDGTWTAPQIAPFAEDIRVERPVYSPDGNSLYFERESDLTRESDADIYVVHRTGDGWSEPEPVSPLINSPAIERLHTVTADGSMYFTRNLMREDEEVLVSRWVAGAYTAPEVLGDAYNQNVAEYAIVFGPNEDYMLINQQAAPTSANVLVSFKRADGSWSERIETPYYSGGFLSLSPDGKYLFTLGEAIYWISTSFVEDLRRER
jgi:hypothetical protein